MRTQFAYLVTDGFSLIPPKGRQAANYVSRSLITIRIKNRQAAYIIIDILNLSDWQGNRAATKITIPLHVL